MTRHRYELQHGYHTTHVTLKEHSLTAVLALSSQKNDLNIVFQYPLSEPPCFVHLDGSLHESKKSSVIHFLKEKIN